ncbi:MAG: hypothetical protein GKR94_34275 [Gammaproteobacteria bacterium]|nr:hypothetical protein [Gammaproteobacteria bacterium]
MRVASISIGIVAYRDSHLASSQIRLQFASADAMAFHRYLTSAWAGERDLHVCLTDGEADRDGLGQAVNDIASSGDFDLFVLYLSGHGETNAHEGWFCLADAAAGEPSLTRSEIDQLLASVDADQVLLVADYCFAEASLAGSDFFSALEGCSARIYIASARSTQKAWEDKQLGRSILSDVLLKAMSSGSALAYRDGTIDVEARLVPHLREQVPLEATVHKRGTVQEPVMGGTASKPMLLPTVASRDLRRNLSISATIRLRVRRILTVSAAAVLVIWLIADLLFYHLAVGANGAILVRPGLAAFYELTPFHLGKEIDTGFTVRDVSPRARDAVRRLSEGSEYGFTTRKDRDGLARWLSMLEPVLDALFRGPGTNARSGGLANARERATAARLGSGVCFGGAQRRYSQHCRPSLSDVTRNRCRLFVSREATTRLLPPRRAHGRVRPRPPVAGPSN